MKNDQKNPYKIEIVLKMQGDFMVAVINHPYIGEPVIYGLGPCETTGHINTALTLWDMIDRWLFDNNLNEPAGADWSVPIGQRGLMSFPGYRGFGYISEKR